MQFSAGSNPAGGIVGRSAWINNVLDTFWALARFHAVLPTFYGVTHIPFADPCPFNAGRRSMVIWLVRAAKLRVQTLITPLTL